MPNATPLYPPLDPPKFIIQKIHIHEKKNSIPTICVTLVRKKYIYIYIKENRKNIKLF